MAAYNAQNFEFGDAWRDSGDPQRTSRPAACGAPERRLRDDPPDS